jgi:hypothetical protein
MGQGQADEELASLTTAIACDRLMLVATALDDKETRIKRIKCDAKGEMRVEQTQGFSHF